SSGGRGKGALSFAVDVFPVEARRLEYSVNAPGTVEAFERVQVTARVAGAVDKVSFSEGQQVKKGDTLVTIDAERYRLSVNSAKAALDKSQASRKDTEAMIARREGASESHPGLIPGEELATYRTKGLTAKADEAVSQEALRSAQLNLRDAVVRAPMDGVIQTRTIETGQYVQPGYVMATLLRNDPMLLRFQASPQEAPRLKAGQVATFKLRETLNVYTARITLVAASADEASHMVDVQAEVNDDGHKYWLRPGSFADVSIAVGAGRDAVVIPRAAVRPSERGFVAYVVDGAVARERVLQLGMNTRDGWVEVRDGLKPGDRLVLRGGEALSDGAKVKVNDIPPPVSSALAASSGAPVNSAGPG
ncbi:MAG: efflux RND transporter periplasmic adaptor subunit, partial [Myxococcales bacterium]